MFKKATLIASIGVLLVATAHAQPMACTKIGFQPGTPDPNRCYPVVNGDAAPAAPAPRPIAEKPPQAQPQPATQPPAAVAPTDYAAPIAALRKHAAAGIAQAAAIVPMLPARVGNTTLHIGGANYGGQSALGLSIAHRPTQSLVITGGFSAGTSGPRLVRIGAGIEF